MSEKEKKIEELKSQIRDIKLKGSFKKAYQDVRKGTVEIAKSEKTEQQKKNDLKKLCSDVISEME